MKIALPLTLLALAGCATTSAPAPTPEPAATHCEATKLDSLVGQPVDHTQARAKALSGATTVRVYESGSAVTMDFRQDRLNIETDAKGVVVRFSCG